MFHVRLHLVNISISLRAINLNHTYCNKVQLMDSRDYVSAPQYLQYPSNSS